MSEIPPPPPPPPPAAPPPAPVEPTAVERNHDLSSRVRGLSCPSCSGALDVDLGLRVLTCPYCRSPLLAVHELGTRRLAVEAQVDGERARELARQWLRRGISKDPRLAKEAPIGEAFLSFLPFYRVEADCLGFALGKERRKRTVGTGKRRRRQSYLVDVERHVKRSLDRTYPAVNVAEWGIARVNLHGDPLVPFDPAALGRQGMVFPPTGAETAIKDAAVERFRERCDPGRGLERVSFRYLTTLRERLSIVYYPIWVVRYHFRKRSYQVLIDAEDGTLAYGKAPGNDFYRAAMLILTEAVALFFATTALQVAGNHPKAWLFVGFLALAMIAWGFHKFRWGGVVVEGSGAGKKEALEMSLGELATHRGRRRVVRELIDGKFLHGGGRR